MAVSDKYAAAHADPHGPGDARPTAMTIVEDEGLVGKLVGKVVLITGCSSGIGVETALALHTTGADVFMTVRNVEKGQAVVSDILAKSSGQGKLELIKLELDSLASIREGAAEFLRKSSQLNVLIANAGVMACPQGETKDGFETQFGTNHLGHFLLFQLLRPALLRSSTPVFNSRVVVISSAAHRRSPVLFDDLNLKKSGYDPVVAYGQSKTANIHMALEIERRYGPQGLHSTAVMPGVIYTELWRHLSPDFVKNAASSNTVKLYKNVEQGAATTVWAAVSPELEGIGGKYLEDVSVAKPFDGTPGLGVPGYEKHTYDAEAAKKLWDVSCELVGFKDGDAQQ